MNDAVQESSSETKTRSAGRGVISISAAKLYFIVTGYAVALLLPRLLRTPEAFGLYSSAMNVVSILNNVLIAATVQTVSKHVSENEAQADITLRQGLQLQLLIGGVLGCGLFLLSPWLAGSVLLDPKLTPLLHSASIVVFCYAVYGAPVGALNGRQRFVPQAGLDMSYSTLRSGSVLLAAGLGMGAAGAMDAFAGSAAAVLLLSLIIVGVGRSGTGVQWRRWLAFMAPLWIYQLALNLVLQVDLSVLKSNAAAIGQAAGMLPAVAADEASRLVAFYRAAQTFAFVPYQLILAVTFVVFPMVSQAVSQGDSSAARSYVHGAMRFSAIVLFAIAAPLSGAAGGVMRIAYPGAYLAGSDALAVLSLGIVAFALFVIGATILSGAGRPGLPAVIAVVVVGVVLIADTMLLRAIGLSPRSLVAVASGTALGMVLALIAIGYALVQRFSAFIPPMCALRVLGSAATGWLVAHTIPTHSAPLALLSLVGGALAYLIALVVSRELGPRDLELVMSIVRKRSRR